MKLFIWYCVLDTTQCKDYRGVHICIVETNTNQNLHSLVFQFV